MRKSRVLQIRLTDEEKQGFDAAAELAGLGVSTWVRERLREKAMQELQAAGLPVPFVAGLPAARDERRRV